MPKKLPEALMAQMRSVQIDPNILLTMTGEPERRMCAATEMRVAADGKKIAGHAALFNSKTQFYDGMWQERIAPGAFAKSIKESDVRALFNHDANYVLGRNKAGTLDLSEDEQGLSDVITPPDTQWARDLMESIRRGDVSQQSFAFRTIKDSWNIEDGMQTRTLLEVRLFDVSPVTYPQYEDTDCGLRGGLGGDALGRAMIKLSGGHTLDDEELTLVRALYGDLQARARQAGPADVAGKQEPGQKSATHSSIDVLRRRVDLAEKGI